MTYLVIEEYREKGWESLVLETKDRREAEDYANMRNSQGAPYFNYFITEKED